MSLELENEISDWKASLSSYKVVRSSNKTSLIYITIMSVLSNHCTIFSIETSLTLGFLVSPQTLQG